MGLDHQILCEIWAFYAPEIEDRGAYCFCPVSFCYSVILSFCPPLWNFNLANNFWTMNAIDLIFHMSIPCDKTFLCVLIYFTLWPWILSLSYFLKTLTLQITFEQLVVELWYFTGASLVIRLFRGFHYFLPCVTFTWKFDLLFKNFHLANNF